MSETSNFDAHFKAIRESPKVTKSDAIDDIMLKCGTEKETVSFYSHWAENYEEDIKTTDGGYDNAAKVAACLARHQTDKSSKILDVLCGTGLIAIELRKLGYDNIDGIDGSEEMLILARERGVYHKYFQEVVHHDKMANIDDGSYDNIVTSGSFLPKHLDAQCLLTLGRAVKPGGIIVICHREAIFTYPEFADLQATIDRHIEEGFWKMEERTIIENYYGRHPGVLYAFRKL